MDLVNSGAVGPHKNQVQAIRYDQANKLVLSCGFDDTLKFIDVNEFKYM